MYLFYIEHGLYIEMRTGPHMTGRNITKNNWFRVPIRTNNHHQPASKELDHDIHSWGWQTCTFFFLLHQKNVQTNLVEEVLSLVPNLNNYPQCHLHPDKLSH